MNKFNILVINSDKSTGLNFVKCLNLAKEQNLANYNIIGTSCHGIRSALTEDDKTLILDEELNNSPLKIVELLKEKYNTSIDLVYQTKSAEYMFAISKERNQIPVFLPDNEYIELFEDKYLTYLTLKEANFPVPETFLIEKKEDVSNAFKVLGNEVWVRSKIGQGGRGSFSSVSIDEVIKEIENTNGWGEYTISEKLPLIKNKMDWNKHLSDESYPGEMISWIALFNEGKLIAAQTRKRLYWEHSDLTMSGVTGYTGANLIIDRKDIHELSNSIIQHCMEIPHGAMGIDFLVDKNGNVKLTETQSSRFFTSTYSLALLGLNLPHLYIECFRGNGNLPENVINPCKSGMVYIQRFGAESRLIHKDELMKYMNQGFKE